MRLDRIIISCYRSQFVFDKLLQNSSALVVQNASYNFVIALQHVYECAQTDLLQSATLFLCGTILRLYNYLCLVRVLLRYPIIKLGICSCSIGDTRVEILAKSFLNEDA